MEDSNEHKKKIKLIQTRNKEKKYERRKDKQTRPNRMKKAYKKF